MELVDFTEIFDSYSTGELSPPVVDCYETEVTTEMRFLDSVLKDDKSEFISNAKRLFVGEEDERIEALKLLSICCSYDSINCACSIINGDVGLVPYINDLCDDTGLSPLHTAAESNALRCVEMLLKRRARTDIRSKDDRCLIPLELSLFNGSLDVTWNPSSDSIGDLIVLLSDKDLRVVKLLVEKTKEVENLAYVYAKAGEIVSLTVLLIIATEKLKEATVALRDDGSSVKKSIRKTIYEAVIQEALRSNNSLMESGCSQKRIVLLREIELLQLFGAAVFSETSPLISIVQAGDEAVLELLLNTNIDVNETDAEGNSVIQCSLKGTSVPHKQQTRIMRLLIAHGARVSQKNKLGLSAVHFAAANGNLSALEILLAANHDLVNDLSSPPHVLKRSGHRRSVLQPSSHMKDEHQNVSDEQRVGLSWDLEDDFRIPKDLKLCKKKPIKGLPKLCKRAGHPKSVDDSQEYITSDSCRSDDSCSESEVNSSEVNGGQGELYDSEMRCPRRSHILQRFPLLRHFSKPYISSKLAESCLGKERYSWVVETEPDGELLFSDISGTLSMYWKPKSLRRKFLSRKKTMKLLEKASGFIRNQQMHPLCWAYSSGDIVSASLVLHGWEEEYIPLCPHYLSDEVYRDRYRMNFPQGGDVEREENHSCYPLAIEPALQYVKAYGIPRQKEARFNCNIPRQWDPEEKFYNITKIFKYETMEQALLRLKSHVVGAALLVYSGWDDPGIYRGPKKEGAKYINEHEVVMIGCREIEGEMVVICKASNGKTTGEKGYIFVSLEVMVIMVGRKRSKIQSDLCTKKPQYLLNDFFSVDMQTGPLGLQFTEKPNRAKNNLKFEMEYDYETIEEMETEDDDEIESEDDELMESDD